MNNNRCVICQEIIPEGRQVCPICETKSSKTDRPCYNCQDRHRACHSTCEKYKALRKHLDEINEARKTQERADNDYAAVMVRRKKR